MLTGRKFFSTVRIGSPLSRGVTATFFARSGNLLLRMLMFMAFVAGQIAPLPLSGQVYGVFYPHRLISYHSLPVEVGEHLRLKLNEERTC